MRCIQISFLLFSLSHSETNDTYRDRCFRQGLFLTTGSLQASTPYLGGVLVVVISVWLFAADSLSHKVSAPVKVYTLCSRLLEAMVTLLGG